MKQTADYFPFISNFFHSTTYVEYYSIFPKFLKRETQLLNLFTAKYFILSW